jgi:hypothetical protein
MTADRAAVYLALADKVEQGWGGIHAALAEAVELLGLPDAAAGDLHAAIVYSRRGLDAIVSLQEAVLPGWTFTIRSGDASDGDGRWHECVMENWRGVDRGDDAPQVKSFGFIPETNARLAAVLRALAMESRTLGGDHG